MKRPLARLASHILFAAEFLIALGIVGVLLWHYEVFRSAVFSSGDHVVAWTARRWPTLAETLASQPARWVAFSLIALLVVALLGIIFRLLARRYIFFVLTIAGIRLTVNVLTLCSSIWFAVYLHTILWGDVNVLGAVIAPSDNPSNLYFGNGIEIGFYCLVYALIQGAPFLFKPDTTVGWFVFDTILSAVPMFVLGSAWFSYELNPDSWQWWTHYRVATMQLATLVIAVDLTRIFTGAHLLLRGYVDSGTIAAVSGH